MLRPLRTAGPVLLLGLLLQLLQGQQAWCLEEVVFTDYSNGWTAGLYADSWLDVDVDPTAYSTDSPGLLHFSLSWAGDLTDSCALFASSADDFTLVAVGPNAADCELPVAQSVTLTAANPQCNYTLAWTYPFQDLLTFVCTTGAGVTPVSGQSIGLLFNSSSALAQGGSTASPVYQDEATGASRSLYDPDANERLLTTQDPPAIGTSGLYTGDGAGAALLTLSWNLALEAEAEVWFWLPGPSSLTLTAGSGACAFLPPDRSAAVRQQPRVLLHGQLDGSV